MCVLNPPLSITNLRAHHTPMASFLVLLALTFLSLCTILPRAPAAFTCNTPSTCNALIDYVSPNSTTLSSIQSLFGVKNLRALLGANSNSFPASASGNQTVAAKDKIVIPFPCRCSNGTGISNHRPVYTVQKDDGLYHIAAEVFAGLVTYQEIQAVNNISNADLIDVGQRLWIPLPCSCDEVNGSAVVHYGHVVESGSSVEQIANDYGTTQETLLRLNNMTDPKTLQAGAVLDVPLKACTSMVGNNSLDYPLLVANGTYFFTANSCVRCKCDAANNYTLQCEPSQLELSNRTCLNMQCEGSNLYLGDSTSSGCNRTTCAYAGYTNQTILTSLVTESTCSSSSDAGKMGLQGWSWVFCLISSQLVCLHLHLHLHLLH